ncbi:NosD domain-containing protein [Methanobrevibacter arboriphilus]|nr:NosD domain-containing protein [Methanobrevibacter arboriphilus]
MNKQLTLKSLSGNSTFMPSNNSPVFSINSDSVSILDLIIKSSMYAYGIFVNGKNNITISGNNITNGCYGISAISSNNLFIEGNYIFNSTIAGIDLNGVNNVSIYSNIINNSNNGIYSVSANGEIISNIFSNNQLGLCLEDFFGYVNFNAIFNNSYGMSSIFSTGIINANNNWWGNNDIFPFSFTGKYIDTYYSDVTCDYWLVLKTNVERDFAQSNNTHGVYIVTADLTHNNNGEDTSDGILPDGLPINFSTTRGTINSTAYTSAGKAKATLKITNNGQTNVTTVLNDQSVLSSSNLNVTMKGVYNNRTKNYFDNIQQAINNATSGDVILLSDGIYLENIVINKKIVIKAINSGKVVINPYDFEKNVFTINSGGNGSTIIGLVISEAYDAYGIFLNWTSNCNIINNTIKDNDYAIFLQKSTNNNISGNNISYNNYGIYLENSTDNQILKNNVKDIPNYAIYLENSIYNILIENTINNGYNGVYLENSTNNNISSNKIIDSYFALYVSESDSLTISKNNLTNDWIGIYLYNSSGKINDNNIISSNYGICLYDSIFNITEVNFTNTTENLININSTGIVMSDYVYDCGPASLATVLKNLGINTTLEEIIELTGSDISGTSMYGLIQAAREKGLIVEGVNLSVDKLRQNNIVFLMINGEGHFVVIKNITNNIVYLADSSLGNINMTMEKFLEFYSGKAIIITNNATDTQLINITLLSDNETEILIGKLTKRYIGTQYFTISFKIRGGVVFTILKRKNIYPNHFVAFEVFVKVIKSNQKSFGYGSVSGYFFGMNPKQLVLQIHGINARKIVKYSFTAHGKDSNKFWYI